MSAMRTATAPRVPVAPPLAWWLFGGLCVALSLFVHWVAGFALLGLVVIWRARPLDFLTSYLIVVLLGSFINYGSGTLTAQLTVFSGFLVFMLYCYVLERRWDALVIPRTPATVPLLIYSALTIVNYIRGMVVGNSARYAGLELLALLAMMSCLLVASKRFSKLELRFSVLWIWAMSLGHFALGAYIFSIIHMRTIGVYFAPVPGVVAMIVFNFAIRQKSRLRMFLWLLAMAPLLAQQFLSFTRGFWMALIAGILFSLVVYIGRTAGVRDRMNRAGTALAMLAAIAAVGIAVLAVGLGIGHVFELAGNRFASSAGTKYTWESSSNVVRLVEYFHVLDLIVESPIFGHGLGYFFVVREPINFSLVEQWFVHEQYLLVTLKQGLVGLALWVWMLVSFIRTGLRGRRLADPDEQAWCVGTAALVVYCMVYGFVHFPLAETNTTFTFALAVGGTMRYVATDTIALRWKNRRTDGSQA